MDDQRTVFGVDGHVIRRDHAYNTQTVLLMLDTYVFYIALLDDYAQPYMLLYMRLMLVLVLSGLIPLARPPARSLLLWL